MWEFLTFSYVLHLGPWNAWSLSLYPQGTGGIWHSLAPCLSQGLGLAFHLCPASWFLQRLCFCPCSFSTLYLKRYSWRTLFFLIAPSSPYSLRTSFPSPISQCLPDTNPVLSLTSWDLDLTFYYIPSAPHNSVSNINGYKSYVLTPQSHLLFPLYHSFSFVRIRHCRAISNSLPGANAEGLSRF